MDPVAVTTALRELLEVLPDDMVAAELSGINAKRRKQLRKLIRDAIQRLEAVVAGLDPVRLPFVFDPANPEVIGRLIGETLLEQPRVPLGRIPRFYGSGVYAIYYTGGCPVYTPVSGSDTPLYVGKADPASLDARNPIEQGERLYARLNGDHARSIRKAKNLDLEDFECRYLVVKSAWQTTAESYLIAMFNPIWNDEVGICRGFGKHGDDPKTRANTRSPWDTLHPGRPWATREGNVPNPLTLKQIEERIHEHYVQNPPRPRRESPP